MCEKTETAKQLTEFLTRYTPRLETIVQMRVKFHFLLKSTVLKSSSVLENTKY